MLTSTPTTGPTSTPTASPTLLTSTPTTGPTSTPTASPTLLTSTPTTGPTSTPTASPTLLTFTPTTGPTLGHTHWHENEHLHDDGTWHTTNDTDIHRHIGGHWHPMNGSHNDSLYHDNESDEPHWHDGGYWHDDNATDGHWHGDGYWHAINVSIHTLHQTEHLHDDGTWHLVNNVSDLNDTVGHQHIWHDDVNGGHWYTGHETDGIWYDNEHLHIDGHWHSTGYTHNVTWIHRHGDRYLDDDGHWYTVPFKEVLICEHANHRLKCPYGSSIVVTSAIYGRSDYTSCGGDDQLCPYIDVLQTMTTCNGRNTCIKGIQNGLMLGDHCDGIRKYMHLLYECRLDVDGGNPQSITVHVDQDINYQLTSIETVPISYSFLACSDDRVHLVCPEGSVIQTLDASFQRTDPWICNFLTDPIVRTCETVADGALDRTNHFIERCDWHTSCDIAVNRLYDDTIDCSERYMVGEYSCLSI